MNIKRIWLISVSTSNKHAIFCILPSNRTFDKWLQLSGSLKHCSSWLWWAGRGLDSTTTGSNFWPPSTQQARRVWVAPNDFIIMNPVVRSLLNNTFIRATWDNTIRLWVENLFRSITSSGRSSRPRYFSALLVRKSISFYCSGCYYSCFVYKVLLAPVVVLILAYWYTARDSLLVILYGEHWSP